MSLFGMMRTGVSIGSLLSTDESHERFEGGERNEVEMVANRPAPEVVAELTPADGIGRHAVACGRYPET